MDLFYYPVTSVTLFSAALSPRPWRQQVLQFVDFSLQVSICLWTVITPHPVFQRARNVSFSSTTSMGALAGAWKSIVWVAKDFGAALVVSSPLDVLMPDHRASISPNEAIEALAVTISMADSVSDMKPQRTGFTMHAHVAWTKTRACRARISIYICNRISERQTIT
jgi:hypothetical protein